MQWDQRGSGKTYAANKPAEGEALTMQRLTQDGVEVARHAMQQLGKRKVILMGGSWGSALAVHMAKANSELFHAYVGTAQLVNYQDDVAAGYAATMQLCRQPTIMMRSASSNRSARRRGRTRAISGFCGA